MYIYTYVCTNLQCNFVEKRSGTRKSMIPCPRCKRAQMRLIKTEKIK